MNLDSIEELEKAATAQGVAFEDFKQDMKEQIIKQQVIGREVGSRVALSKEDEQKFYDEHKEDLRQPEQIRLSEIMVAPANPNNSTTNDAEALAAAKTKAEGLLADIRKERSLRRSPRRIPAGLPQRRAATSAISSAAPWLKIMTTCSQ